jgi:hypothetical protein
MTSPGQVRGLGNRARAGGPGDGPRRWVAGIALVAVAVLATPAAGQEDPAVGCGTKRVYGHKLRILVRGKPIPCSRAREIIRGHCRESRKWSCFSFWPPRPELVWFREKERFAESWSTYIEAERYPCSEAQVTKRLWRQKGDSFPTRQQVLADDLIRCKQLAGKSEKQIVRLLGRPDFRSHAQGKRYLDYYVGPVRDSFFQIDSESLSIVIGRDGIFKSAEFQQN